MSSDFDEEFEIEQTKSITKMVFMTILSIITIIIVIIIIINYIFKFHLVEKVISPNNKYVIEIKGYGSKWPFGSEDIEIVAYFNFNIFKRNKKIYKTKLSNDGKNIQKTNYNIEWLDDSALITISGEEQKNEYILVEFKDKISFRHKGLDYKIENISEKKIIKTYSHYNYYSHRNLELYNKELKILLNNEYIPIDEGFRQEKIDINDFIITMNYEVENKVATYTYESQGNAGVYKNNYITFVVCEYDRYNSDYKEFKNEDYLKYIIADSSLEYKYSLCNP